MPVALIVVVVVVGLIGYGLFDKEAGGCAKSFAWSSLIVIVTVSIGICGLLNAIFGGSGSSASEATYSPSSYEDDSYSDDSEYYDDSYDSYGSGGLNYGDANGDGDSGILSPSVPEGANPSDDWTGDHTEWHEVDGYYRDDGTYVDSYDRRTE